MFAGIATLVIAIIAATATYIDNYYSTSVRQWVANDLRIRIYEHLHRLSLRFYDSAKTMPRCRLARTVTPGRMRQPLQATFSVVHANSSRQGSVRSQCLQNHFRLGVLVGA